VSARQNHSCWDSVTVQHAPLISLFALARHPPPSPSASPPLVHPSIVCANAGRKIGANITAIATSMRVSSSRDLRDSQAIILAFAPTSDQRRGYAATQGRRGGRGRVGWGEREMIAQRVGTRVGKGGCFIDRMTEFRR